MTRKHVAQPPPAGGIGNDPPSQPGAAVPHVVLAKPAKSEYRRNLPHIQADNRAVFVTFCTAQRLILPEHVRAKVMQHCLFDHGCKLWMRGVVVMPDHVHLVFTPLRDVQGNDFGMAEIMNGIKGASAHSVNKLLNRKGHVWQNESFDRVLRSDESIEEKVDYIIQNPVRKGIVSTDVGYPWIWREGDCLPGQ